MDKAVTLTPKKRKKDPYLNQIAAFKCTPDILVDFKKVYPDLNVAIHGECFENRNYLIGLVKQLSKASTGETEDHYYID